MTKRKPAFYTAVYWREGSNWLAELAEEPRVHTFARSLAKAEEHIRDATALWFERDDIPLKHEYRDLPAETSDLLWAARDARSTMATAEKRAAETTRVAAIRLLEGTGLSLRDAAHLLGISHQRLHQLVHSGSAAHLTGDRTPNGAGLV